MTGVKLLKVLPSDGDQRLDRWFKRYYPGLGHGRLEKLLRTGQIRVDGGRAKAAMRLLPGMTIRVPPLDADAELPSTRPIMPRLLRPDEIAELRAAILYIDEDVIAINKPPGLAVQGGTGMSRHLDGMLDALAFENVERPKLVHRLDKDTSGVLILARTTASARWLSAAFRDKNARKVYWAAVVGVPKPRRGRINLAIGKPIGGKPAAISEDEGEEAKDAETYYTVVDHAGQRVSWLALLPLTGRTHQLRIHCAAIGTPILGDEKHAGDRRLMEKQTELEGLVQRGRLHLHAHSLRLNRPHGGTLSIEAPLPAHMAETWDFLGWDQTPAEDPFAELHLEKDRLDYRVG